MAASAFAYYHFQGELGESLQVPNAFPIPTGSPLTWGAFMSSFPLQHRVHSMHCRFQADHPSHGYVWRDMSNAPPSTVLPTYNGVVMAKILSLDSEASCLRRKSLLRRKPPKGSSSSGDTSYLAPAPVQENKKQEVLAATNRGPVSPQPSRNERREEQQRYQSYSQDHHEEDVQRQQPKESPVSPPPQEHNFFSTSSDDYDDHQQASSSVSSSPPPVLNRAELAKKRQHDIDAQVAAALDEKHERDKRVATEERELDEAKTKLDKSLTEWAFDNGKKRNIRTLLATMHTVTWDGCKWKAIGLGDVLSPKQVKLQYRKAMLVVHTDKCSNMDTETKYIAMRLFEAINEAYEAFLEKESV